MDDLISRKAAIDAVIGYYQFGGPLFDPPVKFASDAIYRLPSVPGVPLDKLCEWLEGAEKEGLSCLECADLLRNKLFVAKWMEGLDDHG